MSYTEEQDEEDGELEDFAGDDEFPEDTEGDDLVHCPQCKATMSALCDMCPRCGHWIMESDKPQMAWHRTEGRGLKVAAWVVMALIGGMALVGGVLVWLVNRGG